MSHSNLNNEDENLKKEAPFLFGLKKEEPYQASPGYFEKFQSELNDKIHAKPASWWSFILKPVVWAPTMIILITGSVFLFRNQNSGIHSVSEQKEVVFNLNDISFDVLDAYVSDHLLAQVSTDEILEITGHENISLGITSEESKNEIPKIEHIEEEEMEEYILENLEEMSVEI